MTRRRFALVAAIVVALAGMLTAATWAWSRSWAGPQSRAALSYGPGSGMMGGGYGPGMMGGDYGPGMMGGGYGPGMMGGGYGLAGDGRPVQSLDAARQRAQLFADRLGLRVGEVMQFSNGYYAELKTADGRNATEILIDPASGGVGLEYGPAMMWNTSYGMHARIGAAAGSVSADQARQTAQRWLDARRSGLTAGEAEEFPGYYTLHTTRGDKIVGMMSVNAYTGAVWYHTWHGEYVAMSEE